MTKLPSVRRSTWTSRPSPAFAWSTISCSVRGRACGGAAGTVADAGVTGGVGRAGIAGPVGGAVVRGWTFIAAGGTTGVVGVGPGSGGGTGGSVGCENRGSDGGGGPSGDWLN